VKLFRAAENAGLARKEAAVEVTAVERNFLRENPVRSEPIAMPSLRVHAPLCGDFRRK